MTHEMQHCSIPIRQVHVVRGAQAQHQYRHQHHHQHHHQHRHQHLTRPPVSRSFSVLRRRGQTRRALTTPSTPSTLTTRHRPSCHRFSPDQDAPPLASAPYCLPCPTMCPLPSPGTLQHSTRAFSFSVCNVPFVRVGNCSECSRHPTLSNPDSSLLWKCPSARMPHRRLVSARH